MRPLFTPKVTLRWKIATAGMVIRAKRISFLRSVAVMRSVPRAGSKWRLGSNRNSMASFRLEGSPKCHPSYRKKTFLTTGNDPPL